MRVNVIGHSGRTWLERMAPLGIAAEAITLEHLLTPAPVLGAVPAGGG